MLDTTLLVIQANVNTSARVTESLLEHTVRYKFDIVLIQEPWIFNNKTELYKDCRSINHSSFRVLVYSY
jgi:hypothetical protein